MTTFTDQTLSKAPKKTIERSILYITNAYHKEQGFVFAESSNYLASTRILNYTPECDNFVDNIFVHKNRCYKNIEDSDIEEGQFFTGVLLCNEHSHMKQSLAALSVQKIVASFQDLQTIFSYAGNDAIRHLSHFIPLILKQIKDKDSINLGRSLLEYLRRATEQDLENFWYIIDNDIESRDIVHSLIEDPENPLKASHLASHALNHLRECLQLNVALPSELTHIEWLTLHKAEPSLYKDFHYLVLELKDSEKRYPFNNELKEFFQLIIEALAADLSTSGPLFPRSSIGAIFHASAKAALLLALQTGEKEFFEDFIDKNDEAVVKEILQQCQPRFRQVFLEKAAQLDVLPEYLVPSGLAPTLAKEEAPTASELSELLMPPEFNENPEPSEPVPDPKKVEQEEPPKPKTETSPDAFARLFLESDGPSEDKLLYSFCALGNPKFLQELLEERESLYENLDTAPAMVQQSFCQAIASLPQELLQSAPIQSVISTCWTQFAQYQDNLKQVYQQIAERMYFNFLQQEDLRSVNFSALMALPQPVLHTFFQNSEDVFKVLQCLAELNKDQCSELQDLILRFLQDYSESAIDIHQKSHLLLWYRLFCHVEIYTRSYLLMRLPLWLRVLFLFNQNHDLHLLTEDIVGENLYTESNPKFHKKLTLLPLPLLNDFIQALASQKPSELFLENIGYADLIEFCCSHFPQAGQELNNLLKYTPKGILQEFSTTGSEESFMRMTQLPLVYFKDKAFDPLFLKNIGQSSIDALNKSEDWIKHFLVYVCSFTEKGADLVSFLYQLYCKCSNASIQDLVLSNIPLVARVCFRFCCDDNTSELKIFLNKSEESGKEIVNLIVCYPEIGKDFLHFLAKIRGDENRDPCFDPLIQLCIQRFPEWNSSPELGSEEDQALALYQTFCEEGSAKQFLALNNCSEELLAHCVEAIPAYTALQRIITLPVDVTKQGKNLTEFLIKNFISHGIERQNQKHLFLLYAFYPECSSELQQQILAAVSPVA